MIWSDIPWQPAPRTLRQFAGMCLLFFGGLAYLQVHHGHGGLAVLSTVAAVFVGGVGLVRPQAIRPVFVGWMVAVFPIGWLVSSVALSVVFYGLFTPLGLVFRQFGRDVLGLRRSAGQVSYWISRPPVSDVRRYFRQF